MDRIKGYLLAGLSSSTFGLAPFFTLLLIGCGYSSFEVLTYRWGIASLSLIVFGMLIGTSFRISRKEFLTVFILSIFRAITSFSLVIAYQNIASGIASTIHFMYPLAVAVAMMCFFGEKKSWPVIMAVCIALAGAALLSFGNNEGTDSSDKITGIIAASVSVFSYAAYIVGVRKSRAVNIPSVTLTCYVMGLGAIMFFIGGCFTGGVRMETDAHTWLYILGLALPATAISNMSLVSAIKFAGPTLTSIFGALEPFTAVVIGCLCLQEPFTIYTAIGIIMIITAVTLVVVRNREA